MARTVVAVNKLVVNEGFAEAGSAVDVANGMIVMAKNTNKVFIRVTNSAGVAKNLTVPKGANPPALLADKDLVTSHAALQTRIYVLESARYIQEDGSIHLNFEAGFTGTVTAFEMPRGA